MLDPPHRVFPKPLVQFRPVSSPPTSPTFPESRRVFNTDEKVSSSASTAGDARDDRDISPPPTVEQEHKYINKKAERPPSREEEIPEGGNGSGICAGEEGDEGINPEQRARFEKIQRTLRENNKSEDDEG